MADQFFALMFFPAMHPIPIGASLLVASMAWALRRDAFAAAIFGFSALFAAFEVTQAWLFLSDAVAFGITRPEFIPFYAATVTASLLFALNALRSGWALVAGRLLKRPALTTATLIAAHALHTQAAFWLIRLAA